MVLPLFWPQALHGCIQRALKLHFLKFMAAHGPKADKARGWVRSAAQCYYSIGRTAKLNVEQGFSIRHPCLVLLLLQHASLSVNYGRLASNAHHTL